jgi:hypothetical protein
MTRKELDEAKPTSSCPKITHTLIEQGMIKVHRNMRKKRWTGP